MARTASFQQSISAPPPTESGGVRFSIVTASLRQLPLLKKAVRSVADQGVNYEHVVQDGGTGGELVAWAGGLPHVALRSEPDTGLYDALNRGFARTRGEICGILQCDEQYLPGALPRVQEAFASSPETDLVVGNVLLVHPSGELAAQRRSTPLRRSMVMVDHLYDLTCSIFFRRRVWEEVGPFRADLRAVGDAEWMARVLQRRPKIVYLEEYVAAFTLTGQNLSLGRTARAEEEELRKHAPAWARMARPLLRRVRHVEKWLHGGYRRRPISYALYTQGEDAARTQFYALNPGWRHPWTSGAKMGRR